MASIRNYEEDKNKLKRFLNEYYDESNSNNNSKIFTYKNQMQLLKNRQQESIFIKLDDISSFDRDLVTAIEHNGHRYQKLISDSIDEILYEMGDLVVKDSFDSFLGDRLRLLQQQKDSRETRGAEGATERVSFQELRSAFPVELWRRYEAFFVARRDAKCVAVRQVLSETTGKVIRVKGVVTRATQVKPMLRVATYVCDRCAGETYQEIVNQSFLPLTVCLSDSCKNESSKNGGRLHMVSRSCKYVKLQELRVQELSEQVPIGNIPRGMMVHCTGPNTRLVQPGDNVYISGVMLPSVNNSSRSFSQSLSADTYLEAHSIALISKVDSDDVSDITEATPLELDRLRDPAMYGLLAKSIAPEIFGHEDIKKALLVMMSGGTRVSPQGMKIRGSLNMCLMGDPGVAKSQLLCFVDRLCPRSQYTTGRGCSGVGLTAAVVKDQLTGEMTLEGGSLVLADEGVCCIDEFDKMADSDRTAIHEVMEQQTISIAKAGIMTTLNARVSILAAANPAYGRYNPRKTIEQNIDLPAALLSRFDMLWLIQDKPDRENDLRLAQHITHVHREGRAPPRPSADNDGGALLSMSELRRYIAVIRSLEDPVVPESLGEYFVGIYVSLRKETRQGDSAKESLFTSPRTLLALLRIATSLARIRCRREVDRSDADEAMRLLESSKSSVHSDKNKNLKASGGYRDAIYQAIRRLVSDGGDVRLTDVAEKCTSMGYTPDQVTEVVDCYEQLNVWQINVGRTRLHMI